MPNQTLRTINPAILASVDAFQALANIYLTSTERLLELNLSTLREAVEGNATVMKNLLMKEGAGYGKHQAAARPLFERFMTYSRSAYEILATTQQEVAGMLPSQLAGVGADIKFPADWKASFDQFIKGVQQLSSQAAQSNSSATEARSKALAESLAKARRAA